MAKTDIVTLDLGFQGMPHAIASYLIRHSTGAILVECGPGSTLAALQSGLAGNGLAVSNITHVLLTHIHLDHAGAAGWLARQGAQIIVHPVGAPHLLNPEKLLTSAARIYGEKMDMLWGEFLPVPEDKLTIVQDGEEIVIGKLRLTPINTPGHAEHHYAYLFEDICFSGDVGGVRISPTQYLRIPMPPPELHIGRWRESISRLKREKFRRIAPTHFGIFDDPVWHLQAIVNALEETELWLAGRMPHDPSIEELRDQFTEWMDLQGSQAGLSGEVRKALNLANPPGMSADGLFRYWNKTKLSSSA